MRHSLPPSNINYFFNQLTVKSHTMDILRLSYCHQGPTQFMIQRHRREERGAGGNFPSTMQTQVKFLVLQYDLRKIKKEISFVYMTFSYNATVTAKYDLICIPKLQYCFIGNSCSYREASKTLKDFFLHSLRLKDSYDNLWHFI